MIKKFLETHYKAGEPIILACSTGPDSMFLLYKILETPYKKNLIACYFNHNLRPESADEEIFLENLGKKYNFRVEIASAKIAEIHKKFYKSISLEELCRQKRQDFYNAILHIYHSDKILLAHHLDDKIETFLFNLARGSKLSGLINMTEKSAHILRPLLKIPKKEILEYLEKNNLEYKIDSTNSENIFSRNKIRNQITPIFEEINSNYRANFAEIMDYLENVKNFIDSEVQKFLQKNEKEWFFDNEEFGKLDNFLQKEIIRYIFYISNNRSTIGLSRANIDEILRFLQWKNNKTIKEIKNLQLFKDNKKIFYKNLPK